MAALPAVVVNGQPQLFQGRQKTIYLSHSSRTLYEVCPRKYRHRYVDRLMEEATSVNLVYGTAVDEATGAFMAAHALGRIIDPVPIFERTFDEEAATKAVRYSTKFDSRDTCVTSGKRLVELFVQKWLDLGYTAILDPEGKPLVQVEIRYRIEGAVEVTGFIDVIARDRSGRVLLLDVKTPSAASGETFTAKSMQLTNYQVGVEADPDRFGIDRIDGLGFFELIKRPVTPRGAGPEVLDPVIQAPRTREALDEYVEEMRFIADDIRKKRFPCRPLDAYNSPCGEMCEFSRLCAFGDATGLVEKKPQPKVVEAPSLPIE